MIKIKKKKIAVIGDLMLDQYIIGVSDRISPEAPIPIVDVKNEYLRLGGSANVCLNIVNLSAIALPFGVIGDDFYGKELIKQFKSNKIDTSHILELSNRPTTVKTRIISSNKHVVRVDREVKTDLSETESQELIEQFKNEITTISALIFQDYNKGVITKKMIDEIAKLCLGAKIPIFVDPKYNHFFDYKNTYLFKPNLRELKDAVSKSLKTMNDYKTAMLTLKQKISAENMLLTLSAKGMLFLDNNNYFHLIRSTALKVLDVSGAGDTVIATLISTYVSGYNLLDAVKLANKAAGIVIGELGIIPIRVEEL